MLAGLRLRSDEDEKILRFRGTVAQRGGNLSLTPAILVGDNFARAYEKAFAKDGLEGYSIAAYENLEDARRDYPAAPVLTAADL